MPSQRKSEKLTSCLPTQSLTGMYALRWRRRGGYSSRDGGYSTPKVELEAWTIDRPSSFLEARPSMPLRDDLDLPCLPCAGVSRENKDCVGQVPRRLWRGSTELRVILKRSVFITAPVRCERACVSNYSNKWNASQNVPSRQNGRFLHPPLPMAA